MAKIRLVSNSPKVQGKVIVYTDPQKTIFTCNVEDIQTGSSAGPVRCVHGLQVLHDESGPYTYCSAEEQAALGAAGLLA